VRLHPGLLLLIERETRSSDVSLVYFFQQSFAAHHWGIKFAKKQVGLFGVIRNENFFLMAKIAFILEHAAQTWASD